MPHAYRAELGLAGWLCEQGRERGPDDSGWLASFFFLSIVPPVFSLDFFLFSPSRRLLLLGTRYLTAVPSIASTARRGRTSFSSCQLAQPLLHFRLFYFPLLYFFRMHRGLDSIYIPT